ncbi:MAG: MBOAT family protein [Bacteroidia bacterium]|nr:MBOAT family protein [Bacteroidia bacterium]
MLFNSAIFLVFFICVYILYWFVFKKQRLWVLLLSGCVFYGCWDWRFLILLFFTSGVDFFSAQKIESTDNNKTKKQWLIASVLINLITLGIFKYYNFFAGSFVDLLNVFGLHPSFTTLKIILPVGISFYTFQSIAYVTDVYRNKVKPERSALHYFAFICFFPQMVAGPIERAKKLLPQFKKEKTVSVLYFETGINLILYGFFKKIVIADNLALIVDELQQNPYAYGTGVLSLGIFAFAVQIYTDFSGYSDIARGCAQLLGFKLSKNFYFPYFSVSLKQFWQRWHISLSTWFRDYVYISLGGNKTSTFKRNINLLVTFVVSGLWHGANFTFILWGFFHGIGLIVEKSMGKIKIPKIINGLFVFLLVAVLFTLFRAPSVWHFLDYFKFLLSFNEGISAGYFTTGNFYFIIPFLLFVLFEISKYKKQGLSNYKYNFIGNFLIVIAILLFAVFENAPSFIYFQF